jgi:type IV secretory pathway VirB3-like protein
MIRRDPLFKGCTRPALVMGVPMAPLVVVMGVVCMASLFTSVFVVLLLVPVIGTMRAVAKKDDQQFRLLGLKLWCRLVPHHNFNRGFWGASTYSPLVFKKR